MSNLLSMKIVKKFKLDGTIDGHDPIGVTWKIICKDGHVFRLCVISVNWGRGYDPGEFKRNVMRVLNRVGEMEYVVLLIQELDEEDPGKEHVVLAQLMEDDTHLVRWETREPIAVSPKAKVSRKRKVMTMDQGTAIGAPKRTGPRRYFVSCLVEIHGIIFGLGNQHPHRNLPNQKVQEAREEGETVTENEIKMLVHMCDAVIDGGDFNSMSPAKAHPAQKIAYKRGLDQIRWIKTTKKMREQAA